MKEKIRVAELAKNDKYPDDNELCIDDWDTCRRIEEIQVGFDGEKGFCDYEIVIQRFSDGKFFKFTYTKFGYHGDNTREQIAYEVEEKQKMITYYE